MASLSPIGVFDSGFGGLTIFMNILIETERLTLRKFSEDDAEPLSAICNQAYVLKWMPD